MIQAVPPSETRRHGLAPLRVILRPLAQYYLQPGYEEIAINAPGHLWMRRRRALADGTVWERHEDPALTRRTLLAIIRVVANCTDQDFDPSRSPTVYATLPGGHRFTAAAGPIVVHGPESHGGGVAMTIRQQITDLPFSLEDFDGAPALPAAPPAGPAAPALPASPVSPRLQDRLRPIVDRGAPILLSGGTSSGKSTVLNLLLRMLDLRLRIVTLQDVLDVLPPHPNHLNIVVSRTDPDYERTIPRVIDLMVRLTPDVIITGEISTTNASATWELMRTGHGHYMTTIHADSPEEAFSTFVDRIRHTRPQIDAGNTMAEMRRRLSVVQVHRTPGGRRQITRILQPQG